MKKAINLLFWGYLIVLIRIDFGIDIIPVPLGYLIIATGCTRVESIYPTAQKAWAFATAMIFISVPTIFINVHEQTHIVWQTYSLFIMIIQLIVVYFMLKVLTEIALDYGSKNLHSRLNITANIYIASHLLYFLAVTLSLNISGDSWIWLLMNFMVFIFVLDSIFLLSLRAVRHTVPVEIPNLEDAEVS